MNAELYIPKCIRVLIISDGMSELVKLKHLCLFLFSVMVLVLGSIAVARTEFGIYSQVGGAVSLTGSIVAFVRLLLFRDVSLAWVRFISMLYMTALLLGDYSRASGMLPRSWPLLVLIVDLFLVVRMPQRDSLAIVATGVVWLSITAIEDSFRLGFYDLPGTAPASTRFHSCDCEAPPCSGGAQAGLANIAAIFVFMTDFIATRGFAVSADREKQRIETSIATSRYVAQALADFNLELATEILRDRELTENLPSGLHLSFTELLQNLRRYKPYLPASCLPQNTDNGLTASEIINDLGRESVPSCTSLEVATVAVVAKRVALLVINMQGTLSVGTDAFTQGHTWLVTEVLQTVVEHKGLAEILYGDRIHVSFNAARQCVGYALSAADTGLAILSKADPSSRPAVLQQNINIAASCGNVQCGDVGCDRMRRYAVLGDVPLKLASMERFGCRAGIAFVADMATYKEIESLRTLRLVPQRTHFQRCGETLQTFLFSVLDGASEVMDMEWMYQLDKGECIRYAAYNRACLYALRGQDYSTTGIAAEDLIHIASIAMAEPVYLAW